MSGIVLAVRCHYCSRHRHPREIHPIGTGGARICSYCLEWHIKAIAMLAGEPPPGCQQCGVTFAFLQDCARSGDLRMYLHAKDGIYQILCRGCSDGYIAKRRDLYAETQFGHSRNIQ